MASGHSESMTLPRIAQAVHLKDLSSQRGLGSCRYLFLIRKLVDNSETNNESRI